MVGAGEMEHEARAAPVNKRDAESQPEPEHGEEQDREATPRAAAAASVVRPTKRARPSAASPLDDAPGAAAAVAAAGLPGCFSKIMERRIGPMLGQLIVQLGSVKSQAEMAEATQSSLQDELVAVKSQLAGSKRDLTETRSKLATTEGELAATKTQLQLAEANLAELRAVKAVPRGPAPAPPVAAPQALQEEQRCSSSSNQRPWPPRLKLPQRWRRRIRGRSK